MSTPNMPPGAPPRGPRPSQSPGFFQWIRNLRVVRSTQDRWIGGVAAGVARRLGLDPLIVRGVLFISLFLGGLGLVLYAAAWVLLPEESDGRIHFEEMMNGNFNSAIVGAGIMLFAGIFRPDNWGAVPWGWLNFVIWPVLIVVVIVLIAQGTHERRRTVPNTFQTPTGPEQPQTSNVPQDPTTVLWAEGTESPSPTNAPTVEENVSADQDTEKIDLNKPAPPPSAGTHTNPPFVPTQPYVAQPYVTQPYVAQPFKPVPPRVLGPGSSWVGIVVALCFFAIAGLILTDRFGALHMPLSGAIFGVCVLILGAGIVVSGLRGRSSGILGFFAIVMIIIGIPIASWGQATSSLALVPDDTWRPKTAAVAEGGISGGVGQTTVDLTKIPDGPETVTVPVNLGIGQITIRIPADKNVTVKTKVNVGEVDSNLNWQSQSGKGGRINRVYSSSEKASKSPDIVVEAHLNIGNITIEER